MGKDETAVLEKEIAHAPEQHAAQDAVELFIAGNSAAVVDLSGVVEIDNDSYHADQTAVSSTVLKQILRSPAHMKAFQDQPHKTTPSRLIGNALHSAVLEPEKFDHDYIVWDGGDRRGKVYTSFVAENPGKSILTREEMDDVLGMCEAVLSYTEYPIGHLLRTGINERAFFWTDKQTGVRCKIKPDNVNDYCILDLKSTDDARPFAFERQIAALGYDFQAAMYQDGHQNETGRLQDFYFIAVEDAPPYGVYVHQASPEMLAKGYADYRRALDLYQNCLKTGQYPGYEKPFSVINLPKWALRK